MSISSFQSYIFVLKVVSEMLIVFTYFEEAIVSCNFALFLTVWWFFVRHNISHRQELINLSHFEEVIYYCLCKSLVFISISFGFSQNVHFYVVRLCVVCCFHKDQFHSRNFQLYFGVFIDLSQVQIRMMCFKRVLFQNYLHLCYTR